MNYQVMGRSEIPVLSRPSDRQLGRGLTLSISCPGPGVVDPRFP